MQTKIEFGKLLTISSSHYSEMIMERSNPSLKMIVGLLKSFPNLNLNWLFYNEGEMFLSDKTVTRIKEPQTEYRTEFDSVTEQIQALPQDKRNYMIKLISGLLGMFQTY